MIVVLKSNWMMVRTVMMIGMLTISNTGVTEVGVNHRSKHRTQRTISNIPTPTPTPAPSTTTTTTTTTTTATERDSRMNVYLCFCKNLNSVSDVFE
jgi:hypothetical protein